MSDDDDKSVTWRWTAGVIASLLLIGISAWLTVTAQRLTSMEETLVAVRIDVSAIRSEMIAAVGKQLDNHEKRIDRLEQAK